MKPHHLVFSSMGLRGYHQSSQPLNLLKPADMKAWIQEQQQTRMTQLIINDE